MNEFWLFFWGLICHIGDPANPDVKTHAALAEGDDHVRQLIFRNHRIVSLESNLTFTDQPGFALTNEDFEGVSSLRALAGQQHALKDSVQRADPVAGTAFHVQYPSNAMVNLGVANLYPNLGRHVLGSTQQSPRIIPRITYAKITTTATELPLRFLGAGPQDVLTRQDPCVLIANVETTPNQRNDFKEYHVLLVGDPDPGEMIDLNAHGFQVPFPGPCNWIRRYVDDRGARERIEAALSTECGNTQWP